MMLYTLLSAGITIIVDILVIFCAAKIMQLVKAPRPLPDSNNVILESSRNSMPPYINSVPEMPAEGKSLDTGIHFFGQRFEWIAFLFLILASIVLFVIIFHLLTHRITRYIQDITGSIQKIAQGDFSTRLEVQDENEFSIIAQNLNVMALDLKLAKEKEKKAENTKNELITNVAHDLRTPLTSIIGYLDILNTKPDITEEERKKYMDIAYNKSKRLESMINDLFSFTKLTYGNMPIKQDMLDVVKLLEQQIEEFYLTFEDYNLVCEFKAYEPNAYVLGDGAMIARAFENLISNAIKYGKDGKIVKVITKKEANFIKVSVINYGSVIPKEDLPYIFDRFYRVEQSRAEVSGGTGLGLSIAKGIIEKHGGRIEARSSMAGTVFEVYLKLVENPNLSE